MLSQIVGSLSGSFAVVWSDVAVGVVLVAAALSFVTAVVLTVGRGRSRGRDELYDSSFAP